MLYLLEEIVHLILDFVKFIWESVPKLILDFLKFVWESIPKLILTIIDIIFIIWVLFGTAIWFFFLNYLRFT